MGHDTSKTLRFVCMSDTHGKRSVLNRPVPSGDVLLYAGDFTHSGEKEEFIKFNKWMKQLPHKHKIVILGNHDINVNEKLAFSREEIIELLDCCTYLHDEFVMIEEKVKVYGTPWFPNQYKWIKEEMKVDKSKIGYRNIDNEYYFRNEDVLLEKWMKIPIDIDILLTHIGPRGIRDWTFIIDKNKGSTALKEVIENRLINLKASVFGHMHNMNGFEMWNGVMYVNSGLYFEEFVPFVFDYVV